MQKRSAISWRRILKYVVMMNEKSELMELYIDAIASTLIYNLYLQKCIMNCPDIVMLSKFAMWDDCKRCFLVVNVWVWSIHSTTPHSQSNAHITTILLSVGMVVSIQTKLLLLPPLSCRMYSDSNCKSFQTGEVLFVWWVVLFNIMRQKENELW